MISEVLFQSTPPGALVRLKSKTGTVVAEGRTPATLRVPADEYRWELQLDNFLTDKSGPLGLQLFAKRADTVSVSLTRADDRVAVLERANAAFKTRGGCAEAIPLYESVRQPSEMSGDRGTEWAESRMRLGQCYRELREYEKAARSFGQVLSARPGQWSAKFESGMTSCNAQDFDAGLIAFREMGGAFLGRVDASRKRGVQLLARYGAAYCRVQQLERLGDTERNRDLRESAVGSLDEFISGAESYLGDDIPSELRAPLEQALRDAKSKRQNLDRG
jgi:tetratricopeptide (TPR) repeat protein